MKKLIICFLISSAILCSGSLQSKEPPLTLHYTVDLTHFDADSFFVKLDIKNFDRDTAVFQFAVTAPGTYSILDAGRFIGNFRAYDAAGKGLPIYRVDINQFRIFHARSLARITYRVDDTFDSPIEDNPVDPMSGTNIELDNALINGQMIFGYFHGYQSQPVSVKYVCPKDWSIGTALKKKDGTYHAASFDELVDSPAMFGKMSRSKIRMGRANIEIYTYSQNRRYSSEFVTDRLKDVLNAAERFLGKLPVERYVFLFHFRESTGPVYGAWEHNYSSFYVIPEWNEAFISQTVTSMAAHEFFHVLIPLNIHSELISPFNFENPVPSMHLWLYEGVTEWASDLMQVRYGTMSDTELMGQVTQKLRRNDYYDNSVSLVNMSLGSYDKHESLYGNIYERGALTAMLLDMRLLELSEGKTGLRDVIGKLSETFGPTRPFPEELFFDILVKMTYPEIGDFIESYIRGTKTLPVREYLEKAGYEYRKEAPTGLFESNLGKFAFEYKDELIYVTHVDTADSVSRRLGIVSGDILLKLGYAGTDLPLMDTSMVRAMNFALIGEPFSWLIKRNNSELRLKAFVGQRSIMDYHVIRPLPSLTPEQKRFRQWWLGQH